MELKAVNWKRMWRNFVLSWLKYRADTCCKVISVLCWTTVWYVAYSKTCPKPEAWKPSKWRRRSSKQKSHLPFRAQLQIPPCLNSTRPTFLKVVFYKSIFGGFPPWLAKEDRLRGATILAKLAKLVGKTAHTNWAVQKLVWLEQCCDMGKRVNLVNLLLNSCGQTLCWLTRTINNLGLRPHHVGL